MPVLVIVAYEDFSGGDPGVSAVVEMPPSMTGDEVFVQWYRENYDAEDMTDQIIMEEAMFVWIESEVEKLES